MNITKSLQNIEFFKNLDLQKILFVVITFFVGLFILKLFKLIINKFFIKSKSKQFIMLFNKLSNYLGFSILFLIILGQIGISLATILGAAGVFGIAIGIASQKSLGNIISGFFMITEKSFEIGDVLKIGENVGTVYAVELLSIMLKTFDNKLIRIPNETLISSEITNITRFPIRRLDLEISVSYNEDLKGVLSLLEDIATKGELYLDEPKPYLVVKGFSESSIVILLGVWFQKENFQVVKNGLMLEIIEKFRENNIEIPFNQLVIHNK